MKLLLFAITLSLFSPSLSGAVVTNVGQEEAKRIIAILDYIVGDYLEAIPPEGGKILNPDEYQEMINFVAEIKKLSPALDFPAEWNLDLQVKNLGELVRKKSSLVKVTNAAMILKEQMIHHYSVPTYPAHFPDIDRGRKLYARDCASCHGLDGMSSTELAHTMTPPPRVLADNDTLDNLSPFKAFNTLTYGVKGTAMASFDTLSEEDRWSLAAYVFTFRQGDRTADRESDPFIHWKVAMRYNDKELVYQLMQSGLSEEKSRQQLQQIRHMQYLSERPTWTEEEALAQDSLDLSPRARLDVLILKNRAEKMSPILDLKAFRRAVAPVLHFLHQEKLSRTIDRAFRDPRPDGHVLDQSLLQARSVLLSARKIPDRQLFLGAWVKTVRAFFPWFLLIGLGIGFSLRPVDRKLFYGVLFSAMVGSVTQAFFYFRDLAFLREQFVKSSVPLHLGTAVGMLSLFALCCLASWLVSKRPSTRRRGLV